MRWACKLVCRDLKALASRCNNRVRGLVSNLLGEADYTVRIENEDEPACAPSERDEVDNEPRFEAESVHTVPSSSSRTVPDRNSTLPTEASQAILERPTTLYNLLSQNLKDLYASRERDLPHGERWIFRGAWLIFICRHSIALPILLMTSINRASRV